MLGWLSSGRLRLALLVALCAAVTAFALPSGPRKAEAHGAQPNLQSAQQKHGHSHADSDGETGMSEQHAADHSHDTPNPPPLTLEWASYETFREISFVQEDIARVDPAPDDRPPRSLA